MNLVLGGMGIALSLGKQSNLTTTFMKNESQSLHAVPVKRITCLRADTTEVTFSTGHSYTLDPQTSIEFLQNSPLSIPEEGYDGKLGILIGEVGSLQEIDGRLSYVHDSKKGLYHFYLDRIDGGVQQTQSAGSVKDSTKEVELTLNRGFADGVVIVGTVDTVSGKSR